MPRNNLVILIAGARGQGKTDWVKNNVVSPSKMPRKLITDTFDSPSWRTMETFHHPEWSSIQIPVLPAADFSRWQSGTYRIFGQPDALFSLVEKHASNCLVVYEDATKYIGSHLTSEMRRFIYDTKQKNIDSAYIFHSLAAIPPELVRAADILVLFKTNEGNPSKEKYPFPEIPAAMEKLRSSSGPFTPPVVLRLN